MPSKFDLLREGHAVEFEPGVTGKLNRDKRTLELSTGEILDASRDTDFFPQDDRQLKVSRQKESIEKGIKGPVGEFLYQYGNQGIPGGISDVVSYLSQNGEDYANRKAAESQVGQRISKESPYISGGATLANIATDLALTRGMSAAKAAPILTAGSAGSRLFTEPEEVAGEALVGAGFGYGIDKSLGYLNRVASRRQASQALPGQQQAVRNLNAEAQENYNLIKQNVKNANEAQMKQYQKSLDDRQSRMIDARNNFEKAKLDREAEVIRLKNEYEVAKAQRSAEATRLENEYKAAKVAAEQETKRLNDEFKLAQKQYEEAVRDLPRLQKEAQAAHSAEVVKNSQEIERNFPKNSRITTEELGVKNFIDDSINKTGLAGSTQANQARRILNSIFPEGEMLRGREISKRYRALEDAIQRSSPEVQTVLNDFKNHLAKRLPAILEDSVAYSKILPLLRKNLPNELKAVLKEINFGGKGLDSAKNELMRFADTNLRTMLRHEVVPADFARRLQNGELGNYIANNLLTAENFIMDINPAQAAKLRRKGTLEYFMRDANQKHNFFVQELSQRINEKLMKYEIKAMESARNASKKMSKEVKGTFGMAEPVPGPAVPQPPGHVPPPTAPAELPPVSAPLTPPPVAPPVTPQMPARPTPMAEPIAPTPLAEPTLAPPSGMADRMGDLFEKNLMGGKDLVNNPITKLAGLKYLLGNAALPAEAGYLAMNALTSPGAVGQVARMSFKHGGIRAIESWAQQYPSYRNGILENPQDRRSLTKEIEDATDIPIEQKAIFQSKVNRGTPLQIPLH